MLIVMHHTDASFFDAVAPNLDNALQSFRVPMYYFLSGLFFKTYSGFADFLRRKVNNLVVPFVFFHLVGFLVAAIAFAFLHPEGHFHWMGVVEPLYRRWWPYTMPLWFLMSLFEVNIIYYLMKRFLPIKLHWVILLALSVLPLVLAKYAVQLPLLFDTAFVGLPFFALGTIVKTSGWLMPHRYDKWGLLVFPLVAVGVCFFAGHIDIVTQQLPNYLQLYVVPMLSILALMWICKNLRWKTKGANGKLTASIYARIPVIGYWGQFSLIVLGTHDWILTPLDTMLADVSVAPVSLALMKWCIAMAAMFVIIPLMVRVFPRFTAQSPLLPVKN